MCIPIEVAIENTLPDVFEYIMLARIFYWIGKQ